jgi:hypothetical protein
MAVTISDIRQDVGEVYSAIDNGTTALTSILNRAKAFVTPLDSSLPDTVVRPLACAMAVNQVQGGIDPVNKTIGSLSVGDKDLNSMRKYFMDEAKRAAVIQGISLDGLTIILKDSEDA